MVPQLWMDPISFFLFFFFIWKSIVEQENQLNHMMKIFHYENTLNYIIRCIVWYISKNICNYITRKRDFSKAQLDQIVDIDQRACPFWLKVWGMKNTCFIWLVHLTKCQVKDMVKMNKCPSKWPWFSQIGHIEWVGFNQIDHYDLILSQMNDTHLMI